jgi:hypothetical protein
MLSARVAISIIWGRRVIRRVRKPPGSLVQAGRGREGRAGGRHAGLHQRPTPSVPADPDPDPLMPDGAGRLLGRIRHGGILGGVDHHLVRVGGGGRGRGSWRSVSGGGPE